MGKREKADVVGEKRLARRRVRLERRLEVAQRRVTRRTTKLAAASQRQGRRAAERIRHRTEKLRRAREAWAEVAARLANLPEPSPPPAAAAASPEIVAYCLRERARRPVLDPRPVILAGGRSALSGPCAGCGARLVRFGG